MWLKSCPRCHIGDLALEDDKYGWRVRCVQCGYSKDVDDRVANTTPFRQSGLGGERVVRLG